MNDIAPEPIDEMIPLLVKIQSNLAEDLDLETLAERCGYSPFHFHRLFREVVGETPRQYVQRLRLEKAAYLLQITDETILDISLSTGFRNHETFSRAFRRAFGCTPRAYREEGVKLQRERLERNRDFRGENCSLSDVRFETVRPMFLLSIRNLGDYWDIPPAFSEEDRLWSKLANWADDHDVHYRRTAIGLYHDDPTVTPAVSQRCDACLSLDAPVAPPQGMRCSYFPGGTYGVIEHTGPTSTIDQAFRNLADGIRRSKRYTFRDGPAIEVERDVQVGAHGIIGQTYVYLPVART